MTTTPLLDQIRAGYTFDGPVLELGARRVDGATHADTPVRIPLSVLNRHGLVAGATGTGKTKTLQVMARAARAQGVPVFLADIKGDLSGLASPGEGGEKLTSRAAEVGQTWTAAGFPTEFLSLGGMGKGIPVRTNDHVLRADAAQQGPSGSTTPRSRASASSSTTRNKQGLALLDLKDLRAVITHSRPTRARRS